MPKEATTQRLLKFDIVRVFAIIGVVSTHAEAITTSPTNYLGGISWWFANTVHTLASISVPLFVMLTGALILGKKSVNVSYVWSKVFKQFLLPLVIWWVFYYWWQTSRSGLPFSVIDIFKRFFYADIGHLYYLQVVVGLYLMMPGIHWLTKSSSKKRKLYVLASVTILTIVYKLLSFFVFKTYYSTNMLLISLPYVSYLLWGEFLSSVSLKKNQLLLVASISALIVGAISYASYLNTIAFNQGNMLFWSSGGGNFFWDVFTPAIFVLACLIYVFLLNLENVFPKFFRSNILVSIMMVLSVTSFGIYLIHYWVMEMTDTIFRLSIQFISYPLWIWYIQRVSLVLIVSTLLVLILQKIPGMKYIFGVKEKVIYK